MKSFLKFGIGVLIAMALTLQTGSAMAIAPGLAGRIWVVDDNGQDCPGADASNISNVLFFAVSGDTVIVCAGTYTEQLAISSKFGLKLIGKGSPIILAPTGTNGAIILVQNSTDVTIQGLVIDGGYRFSPVSTEMTGIAFRNSSGMISNNIISRIRHTAIDDYNSQGVSIRVYDRDITAESPLAVRILNNTITDFQYAGIWIESLIPQLPYTRHPGGYVPTISKNLIQTSRGNFNTNGTRMSSGIMLDWVAGGSVSGNVLVSRYGIADGFGGAILGTGIYLYNPSHIKITSNTIKAFPEGIFVDTYAAYLVDANTISGNQIFNSLFGGIMFTSGQGGTEIKGNVIAKNKLTAILPVGPGSVSIGLGLWERHLQHLASGNKVTGNTIQGYNSPISGGEEGATISGNKISLLPTPGV